MSTIRTKQLAAGLHTPGATFKVLYTVPAGHHVKLSEVTLESSGADTVNLSTREVSGATDVRLVPDPVLAANVPQTFVTSRALEAGDLVLALSLAAGLAFRYWVSGTLYED